jgi:hypothetical protein
MKFPMSVCVVLVTALESQAVPITIFTDTDTFVDRARDIVIAKCLGPVPDSGPYDDGLYPVDVQVIAVLKGPKNKSMKPGRARIATIYPMEAGKTYLLTSLGGSALGTEFLAIPELSVVELPPSFRLEELKGKALADQVRAVFAARRAENARQQRLLETEEKLLDKAVSKINPPQETERDTGLARQGLRMSISTRGHDKAGNPEFEVAFTNVGDQDATLNLGMMLANGKPLHGAALFPTKIRLELRDGQGKTRELHLKGPNVAGRVDDYVVPLRVGSVYSLKLSLSQFWSPSTNEFGLESKPGKYRVSARFEGGGATHDSARFIMNFWEGKLQSNTLALEQ